MATNFFNSDQQEGSFQNLSGQLQIQHTNAFQRSQVDTNIIASHPSPKTQDDLRYAQNIALLKVQIKFITICQIMAPKTLNTISHAFRKIKQAEINQKSVGKDEKELFMRLVDNFVQKVGNVCTRNTKTKLGVSLGRIGLFSLQGKTRISEKQQSCVSPYKLNSKIDNSERIDSEWQLGQSQGYDKTQNAVRQNRFLKKKKERLKNTQNEFLTKMDQLLSSHEAYLRRK